jgi:hypothetical protein
MNRSINHFSMVFAGFLIACWVSTSAHAQSPEADDDIKVDKTDTNPFNSKPGERISKLFDRLLWLNENEEDNKEDDIKAALKKDKTGTNPVNFTFDARIYNEYLWLNTVGDGNQNVTTFEFRTPFAGGKWQFRVRARYSLINADLNGDGIDDLDDSGFGDTDFRFLTVPYVNMSKKLAFGVGLETFLDTASKDSLGAGAISLGPQVFLALFAPFGIKGTLFVPAYQHKFSVDEADGRSKVRQGLIDLFILAQSKDKQRWALLDPQIILDYEQNIEFMIVDLEVGTMLDKYLGTKGHSTYLRPSIGVGKHRPSDGSIEVGYKIIW